MKNKNLLLALVTLSSLSSAAAQASCDYRGIAKQALSNYTFDCLPIDGAKVCNVMMSHTYVNYTAELAAVAFSIQGDNAVQMGEGNVLINKATCELHYVQRSSYEETPVVSIPARNIDMSR